jgi:hypothetical protein
MPLPKSLSTLWILASSMWQAILVHLQASFGRSVRSGHSRRSRLSALRLCPCLEVPAAPQAALGRAPHLLVLPVHQPDLRLFVLPAHQLDLRLFSALPAHQRARLSALLTTLSCPAIMLLAQASHIPLALQLHLQGLFCPRSITTLPCRLATALNRHLLHRLKPHTLRRFPMSFHLPWTTGRPAALLRRSSTMHTLMHRCLILLPHTMIILLVLALLFTTMATPVLRYLTLLLHTVDLVPRQFTQTNWLLAPLALPLALWPILCQRTLCTLAPILAMERTHHTPWADPSSTSTPTPPPATIASPHTPTQLLATTPTQLARP